MTTTKTINVERARRLYFASYAFSMFGTGLWLPLNAIFLSEERHLSVSQVGAYYTVVALTAVVCNFVTGDLADRRGPFTLFRLAGLVQGVGIALLLLGDSTTSIYLAAVVSGLGNGAFFATQTMVLTRVFGGDRLSRLFGTQFQIMNLAIMVGAATLGLLVHFLGSTGFLVGFAINALSYAVHAWNASGPVRRMAGAEGGGRPQTRPRPWAPYLDSRFLPIIATQLCVSLFGYAQLEAVMPVVFRKGAGLPLWVITTYVALNSVVVVLAQPTATRWVEKHGRRAGLRAALVCWLVSFVPALAAPWPDAFAGRVAAVILFSAVFAVGEVLVAPSMQPLAAASAPRDRIGSYTAAVSLAYSLGLILGPSLLLPVFAVDGLAYWAVVAAGTVLGLIAASRIRAPQPAEEPT